MRFTVTTPTAVVEDVDDVRHIRAEDESGAFGILPGHADFVTVLPVSVVMWRAGDGREGFVLVRQGVMTVRDGARVEIAARGGYRGTDLPELSDRILRELALADDVEDVARLSDTRLHLAAIRQIEKVLRGARGGQAAPPRLESRREEAGP